MQSSMDRLADERKPSKESQVDVAEKYGEMRELEMEMCWCLPPAAWPDRVPLSQNLSTMGMSEHKAFVPR